MRHWDLFRVLTATEFRLRDQGTLAGFLWTLVYPLVIFAILYLLFTRWMSPVRPDYAAALLIGIVQWNFFLSATTAGLTSLRRKAGLIHGYAFPRALIVLSSVAAVLLSHLLEWAVLLPGLTLVFGVAPKASWLFLPALIGVELALVTAIACVLSVAAVSVRDLDHLWNLFLYAVFFLTPVFYAVEILDERARAVVAWNPLAALIEATRSALLGGPSEPMAGAFVFGAAAFVAGAAAVALYGRMSRGVAEHL